MSLAVRLLPRRREVLFPGWWVVVGGFGLQVLITVLFSQVFGAYFVPLQEQFGWSLTLLSGAYSLGQIVSGVIGPLQGWLIDRFGVRAMVRIGLVIFGVGLFLFGFINSAVSLYVMVFVISVGLSLAGWVTVNVAVAQWFRRRRAVAMGLASVGWSFGGLLVPIATWALGAFGWRHMAMGSGVLALAVGLPMGQWMRDKPEAYGLLPDGRAPGNGVVPGPVAQARRPVADEAEVEFTTGEALRTWAFWLAGLGQAFGVFVVASANVHMIPHLVQQLHMSLGMAGMMMGLMTGVSIIGQLVGGLAGDRMDKRTLCGVAMLGHALGMLALAYAPNVWWVVFFAVVHGMAWGVRSPLVTALRADYFGLKSFGSVTGISMFIMLIGSVGGPMIAGFLADRTGDFRLGFTILAVLSGLGTAFFVWMRKPAPPRRSVITAPATVQQG